MNPVATFVAGFDPDHLPALVVTLLFALAAPLASGTRLDPAGRPGAIVRAWPAAAASPSPRRSVVTFADRTAGFLLVGSGVLHVALPIGHHEDATLAALFVASGIAYGWLGVCAYTGRRYRVLSALLVVATLIAYVSVVGGGDEGADQVGIVTALGELLVLGICLVPRGRAPVRAVCGSIAFGLAVVVCGAAVWLTSFAAHAHVDEAAGTSGVPTVDGHAGHGAPDAGGGGAHVHGHDDRAQAGVIMRPLGEDTTPTPAQVAAADALATETRAALARYADIHVAIADGYDSALLKTGLRVHLENKAYGRDGRVLDPTRPEMLMYAIDDGKATLLGAVFQMPVAGVAGPTPGGPITRWHAHDVCLSLVPPGFTVLSAFGTCPPFSVAVTTSEMMHIWTIDHPGGPYQDDAPDAWIRAYNEAHGVPFRW